MTFSLNVDAAKFRTHLASVRDHIQNVGAQLTPVIKGNGYGFGREILTQESILLDLPRIAVGTVWELEQALTQFNGQVQVLEPFTPTDDMAAQQWLKTTAENAHRIIATITTQDLLAAHMAGIRNVMLDGKTSLSRFGLETHQLIHVMQTVPRDMAVLGLTLHLPLTDPDLKTFAVLEPVEGAGKGAFSGRQHEVHSWLLTYRELAQTHGLPLHVSVSHLAADELADLTKQHPNFTFEVRLGTALWLGAPDALEVLSHVLAVHHVAKGQRIGYRQVQSKVNQVLLVVSGGTAHGVALASPSIRPSLRSKSISLVEGINEMRSKVRSPFSIHGHNLLFAEPPHMQVSLLWCDDESMSVGDRITCNMRNTTAQFDVVTGLN
jgi:Alanine racemase, N-terminal domain